MAPDDRVMIIEHMLVAALVRHQMYPDQHYHIGVPRMIAESRESAILDELQANSHSAIFGFLAADTEYQSYIASCL